MRPNERRRIAERVARKFGEARKPSINWKSLGYQLDEDGFPIEPKPMIEEALTVEEKFDNDLDGCDKNWLESFGACL